MVIPPLCSAFGVEKVSRMNYCEVDAAVILIHMAQGEGGEEKESAHYANCDAAIKGGQNQHNIHRQ